VGVTERLQAQWRIARHLLPQIPSLSVTFHNKKSKESQAEEQYHSCNALCYRYSRIHYGSCDTMSITYAMERNVSLQQIGDFRRPGIR